MRSPAQTVAVSLPAVGGRPGRRPTRRRSRHKVTAACRPGSARPTTSVVRERPAASRRRSGDRKSARRGSVLSRPRPTARWARRASGGGAATCGRSRPGGRAPAPSLTLTLSGPFTWVVSRTFPISTLDASLGAISRAAFARRLGRPEDDHRVHNLVHGPRPVPRAQKAAEPASRAKCQSARRAVATRRRAR